MSITLNGHQLKSLLEFVNPDGENIRSNGLQLFFAASFLLPYTFFPELEVPVLLLQSF